CSLRAASSIRVLLSETRSPTAWPCRVTRPSPFSIHQTRP
ncbi:MAG: hypothetical protein AVDCRST_MAG55-2931, partial [uncultured Rubrobacteraceae bacterium]